VYPGPSSSKEKGCSQSYYALGLSSIFAFDCSVKQARCATRGSLSPQWLEQIQDVAQKIHLFLLEKPTGQINFNLIDQQGNTRTENPTRWDILETLLYGDYSHATQRERLNNWLSTPFAEMVKGFLMMEFRDILAYTLGGILHLAHYARIELALSQSR
jgi:hypothetical protein